jgi:hypothetical protein
MEIALELEQISSALEIGCGTGVVSRALAVAPGFRGTITATDVIDIGDVARAFAAQPYIIRQLPRLLADTGFAIESHRSYVIADVGRAEFFSEQLTTWRRLLPVSGVISKGDADLLMNGLEAASAAGTLFWANNFYTFMARKTR